MLCWKEFEHSEDISADNYGNYLNMLNLIAEYDDNASEYIQSA